jgi:hypothetical protein
MSISIARQLLSVHERLAECLSLAVSFEETKSFLQQEIFGVNFTVFEFGSTLLV